MYILQTYLSFFPPQQKEELIYCLLYNYKMENMSVTPPHPSPSIVLISCHHLLPLKYKIFNRKDPFVPI